MVVLALAPLVFVGNVSDVPVVWTGGHSKIAVASSQLIKSQPDWIISWNQNLGNAKRLAMWRKMLKEAPSEVRYDYYNEDGLPEVDFQSSVVFALFGGSTHQVAGYSLLGTVRKGTTLTLRYVPRYYSTVVRSLNDKDEFRNTPFAYFLLPRDFKTLRVEEGIIETKRVTPTKFKLVKTLSLN